MAIFPWIRFVPFTHSLANYCFTFCLFLNFHFLSQVTVLHPFHWENWAIKRDLSKTNSMSTSYSPSFFNYIKPWHTSPRLSWVYHMGSVYNIFFCFCIVFHSLLPLWDIESAILFLPCQQFLSLFWIVPINIISRLKKKIYLLYFYTFRCYLLPISVLLFVAKLLKSVVHYKRI